MIRAPFFLLLFLGEALCSHRHAHCYRPYWSSEAAHHGGEFVEIQRLGAVRHGALRTGMHFDN